MLVILAAWMVAGAAVMPASARVRVPKNFFGMTVELPSARAFARMDRARVRVYRFPIYWGVVAPCPTCRNWGPYDDLIAVMARNHIRALPILIGSPGWAVPTAGFPPESPSARAHWATFVREAVGRYGHHGSFWKLHPRLPRLPAVGWEVWSEEVIPFFWNGHTDPAGYVRLLKLTHSAIVSRDRHAKVVLGALTQTKTFTGWSFLEALYRVPGFKRAFGVIAMDDYAADPRRPLFAVRKVRAVTRANHDNRKPIWVTEIGWATGGPPSPYTTSVAGQESRLRKSLTLLVRNRKRLKIETVLWFQLQDRLPGPGEADSWVPYSGLFTVDGRAKPAWSTLMRFTGGSAGRGRLPEISSSSPMSSPLPRPPTSGPTLIPGVLPPVPPL